MTDGINRAIDANFVEKLSVEAKKGGWWSDILKDPSLVLALRGSYLNVYWKGQSIFHVSPSSTGLKVTTHEKYLLDPDLKDQVLLRSDGDFDLEALMSRGFIKRYDSDALKKIKRAAALFSGAEKTGCHDIVVNTRNSNVIDVEIAFPGKIMTKSGKEISSPRVDIAALEPLDDDHVRLVFWEAKHFDNGELVAKTEHVPVLEQIEGYRSYVVSEQHKAGIERCYADVAANLLELKRMGWQRILSPLFEDVASGRKKLTLGPVPKVGLLIFGFSEAQRDHHRWKEHLEKLKAGTEVKAVGDAKSIQL